MFELIKLLWRLTLDFIAPKQCINCKKFDNYLCTVCCERFVSFFPENYCHVCRQPTLSKEYIHVFCKNNTNLDFVLSVAVYENLIKDLIELVKYQGYFAYIDTWCDLTLKCIDIKLFKNTVLVPVPLHRSKNWKRGFNQTELYAKELAKRLNGIGVECRTLNLINRVRHTKTQVGMTREQRILNLNGAFEFNSDYSDLSSKSIILVDDVLTTGTTLEECANTLHKSNFRKVGALTFARA